MTEAPVAETRTASCRWLWWAVGATVTLVALGVFALPWLVPVAVKPIVSESQALGFNNRTAILTLLSGCLVLGLLAIYWRTRCAADDTALTPVVLLNRVSAEERLSKGLVLFWCVVTLCVVGVAAFFYRDHPAADSAYFVDRLLRLVNGDRFYLDFEFAYGPLLLYPQYVLWLAIRYLGASVFVAYYVFVGALQVLGIGMLAWVLNRLAMPRTMRMLLLGVTTPVMLICVLALGPNYSFTRFLLPFFLVSWTLSVVRGNPWLRVAVPAISTLLALALSPEIGIFTGVALAIALALSGSRTDWQEWVGGLGAVAVAGAGWFLYSHARGSALAGFSAGNANFPVVPGHVAVLYVGALLLAAWGVGATTNLTDRRPSASQVGWLALCLAFSASALGRADWVHFFWSGLGVMLLVSALLWRIAPRFAFGFPVLVGVVFIVSASTFFLLAGVPALYQSGVNSGAISRDVSRGLAHRIGRKYSDGLNWWTKVRQAPPRDRDLDLLVAGGGVFVPEWLNGREGELLASRRALAPVFDPPIATGSEDQLKNLLSGLSGAKTVLISKAQYEDLVKQVKQGRKNEWQSVHQTKVASSAFRFGILPGFPLSVRPANPTLDASLVFARALDEGWVVDRASGDYYILRRR